MTEIETEAMNETIETEELTTVLDNTLESVDENISTGEILSTDIYTDEIFIEKIKDMTFIELYNLGNTIRNEIDEVRGAYDTVNEMIKLDDMMSKQVNSPMTDAKFSGERKDLEKFLEDYPKTLNILMWRLGVLEEKLTPYSESCKSTIFLTDQLINTVDKRIAEINNITDEKYLNKERDLKRLELRKKALANRDDISYIDKKTSIEPILSKNIKESYNLNMLSNTMKDLDKLFGRGKFKSFLVQLNEYNPHVVPTEKWLPACKGFVYHLTRLMVTGEKDGSYIYPKLVFMNLIDIANGIYDLGDGKDVYIDKMCFIIMKYTKLI